MTPRLALLVTLGLLAAGCIAPPGGDAPPGGRTTNEGGEMTAKESRGEDQVVPCGAPLPLGAGAFCATRVLRMEGDVRGVQKMDVDLRTFNGNVGLEGGSGDAWSLVATLTARGATEAEARQELDRIDFAWSHVEDGSHFLRAEASTPSPSGQRAASLDATLPRGIVLVLTAATSNGNVDVSGVATDGLAAHTSNGNVGVEASVTQADLRTSNGNVDAKLQPTGSGRIGVGTSNGAIDLEVPEDARHGYEVDARTSNGRVTIDLRDGKVERPPSNPYYDPQNEARFTTTDYGARAIRSTVDLTTSNGAITVGPT